MALDIRSLFAIGVGFSLFILVTAVFFSATDATLTSTSISNSYLNSTLNSVLQNAANVFTNINTAWQIGAIVVILMAVIGLYVIFTR